MHDSGAAAESVVAVADDGEEEAEAARWQRRRRKKDVDRDMILIDRGVRDGERGNQIAYGEVLWLVGR